MTLYLEIEEIEELHRRQLEMYGGISGYRGTEGRGLVESALGRPLAKAQYEAASVATQAGALLFGLAKNHGFLDGNKRIAVVAADTFLQLNGWELTAPQGAIHDFVSRCSDPDWTEAAVGAFVAAHAIRL
ncbi:MAG: type II toxin-antitoxin system death-on-curing family toxin [Candidatus Sericytochromatia bacterium]|nr:type II toxin-antitoxin system death-on-curing family toxin [Candidatus Sericytochromatia bacterium]